MRDLGVYHKFRMEEVILVVFVWSWVPALGEQVGCRCNGY